MNVIKKIFIIAFVVVLVLPLLFVNLQPDKIVESENRIVAAPGKIYNDDGTKNENYLNDVSTWFDDNVGFRSNMVTQQVRIQYYLFRHLLSKDFRMGPHGEWNYVGEQVIPNYQHLNLFTDEDIESIYSSFVTVNDYLSSRGVQFYYMQCWDKQSIYPEYFPTSVNQYGDLSKTDQIVNRLKQDSSINLIDTKPDLLAAKQNYEPYSKFGDATHWSNRGAYIGYLQLMKAINAHNDDKFRVLQEDDYDLSLVDVGANMFGSIHRVNMSEAFTIKNPTAIEDNDKFTIDADDVRDKFYVNNACGNNTKVLIVGDSYINSFIQDDLAESFSQTILVWKQNIADIQNLIVAYQPDIIIYEQAERELDFGPIINAANAINAG